MNSSGPKQHSYEEQYEFCVNTIKFLEDLISDLEKSNNDFELAMLDLKNARFVKNESDPIDNDLILINEKSVSIVKDLYGVHVAYLEKIANTLLSLIK